MYIVDDKYINQTISNLVTSRLRQDILNGRFAAGKHITIKQISEDYKVSPMPVREAFNCLKGEKLIELEQYKGAVIKLLDEKSISDIYEVRASIEELIMVNIAKKGMDEAMRGKLRVINESIDFSLPAEKISSRFAEVNNIFHETLFVLCDNQYAKGVYQLYTNLLEALKRRYPVSIDRINASHVEHNQIIDAIYSQRVDKIHDLAIAHAKGALEHMLSRMRLETEKSALLADKIM